MDASLTTSFGGYAIHGLEDHYPYRSCADLCMFRSMSVRRRVDCFPDGHPGYGDWLVSTPGDAVWSSGNGIGPGCELKLSPKGGYSPMAGLLPPSPYCYSWVNL